MAYKTVASKPRLCSHHILSRFFLRMNFTAVILVGGQSRRMGHDKAFLRFEGRPLIEHTIRVVRDADAGEVLISGRVGQDFSTLDCPVLLDRTPDGGPLGGIERGLEAANHKLVLALAVDLPHMTAGFLRWLLDASSTGTSGDAGDPCPMGVVPVVRGDLEPLAALYPKPAHAIVSQKLAERRFAVREFADTCIRQGLASRVPVAVSHERCFLNLNTPGDVSGL